MTLEEINTIANLAAADVFRGCCHCDRWAWDMALSRPYSSVEAIIQTADELWASASRTEILEAFRGHARIGDLDALKTRYSRTTADEQGQVLETSETVIRDLHKLNIEYEQRHGFIFIVCATGKSAEQMLALLKERIDNSTSEEIINGAREQAAITRLRLRRLINDTGADHE